MHKRKQPSHVFSVRYIILFGKVCSTLCISQKVSIKTLFPVQRFKKQGGMEPQPLPLCLSYTPELALIRSVRLCTLGHTLLSFLSDRGRKPCPVPHLHAP